MFHDISADMQQVMRALEEQVARDQPSLRSVPVDVGRCLSLLAMSAPQGAFIELGSSGGYSSLWLSLAARARGVTLTTVDLDERKVALARENISRAGAGGSVQVFHGDALDYAARFEEIAFCFSDIEPPELNGKVFEKVVPRLMVNPPAGVPSTIQPRTCAGHICGADCCDLRYKPAGRWLLTVLRA